MRKFFGTSYPEFTDQSLRMLKMTHEELLELAKAPSVTDEQIAAVHAWVHANRSIAFNPSSPLLNFMFAHRGRILQYFQEKFPYKRPAP
jgi:hypothetical protein